MSEKYTKFDDLSPTERERVRNMLDIPEEWHRSSTEVMVRAGKTHIKGRKFWGGAPPDQGDTMLLYREYVIVEGDYRDEAV